MFLSISLGTSRGINPVEDVTFTLPIKPDAYFDNQCLFDKTRVWYI